jgi:hypothetical protein
MKIFIPVVPVEKTAKKNFKHKNLKFDFLNGVMTPFFFLQKLIKN